MREARAPPCVDLPVLALDVVDDGGREPAQERRNDKTHAFARARGREGQDMLWPFVAQVLAIMLAEEYAGQLREARFANVLRVGPAGRAVGREQERLPRAPERHAKCTTPGDKTAAPRTRTTQATGKRGQR